MSEYVAIPEQIKDKIKIIELSVDVIFVNKTPFAISLGYNMKFTTIKNGVDRKTATLLKSFRSIKIVYTNTNIFIKTLFVDKNFEVLRDDLKEEGMTLNTSAAKKQIPQIERQIKVVK